MNVTGWFWASQALQTILLASGMIQESELIFWNAWNDIWSKFWSTLFFEKFELFLCPCTPPAFLSLVCLCSLSIIECIRVKVCIKSLPFMKIDHWFIPCTKYFQNKNFQSFSIHMKPCTIWYCLPMYNDSNHAQNLKV